MKPSACPYCGSIADEPWMYDKDTSEDLYLCRRPGCGHRWTIENGRLKIELPDEWRSI